MQFVSACINILAFKNVWQTIINWIDQTSLNIFNFLLLNLDI